MMVQFCCRGQRKSCAAHPQRMTKRNRAAVGVDLRRIIRNSQRTRHRKSLRCESLIHFDHIHL